MGRAADGSAGTVTVTRGTIPDMSNRPEAVSELRAVLEGAGVRLVAGWATNASNLVHAKTMPVGRLGDFVTGGAGLSPVYGGYSLDGTIQFTPYYGPVGDLRLRLVPEAVRVLGDGLAFGPTVVVTQDGDRHPGAPRNVLDRVVEHLAAAGLAATVGHELEFTLVDPSGQALDSTGWTPYGLGPLVARQRFLADLVEDAERAGFSFEQIHAEYGPNQIEVSLPPLPPTPSADLVVVAKTVVCRAARRHGMAASFSPVPGADGVGNGAHQHLSLARDERPLLAGGPGAAGMTLEGEHAVAGILAGLPAAQGVLTGSVLSGVRLAPGMWSGASLCWGSENREAAVRFLAAGVGNPHGANVEVKVIDPSANPYLASATLLGLALDGIEHSRVLPAETAFDPSGLDDAGRQREGIVLLEQDQGAILDALEASPLIRGILGAQAVAALLAVRRHEREVFGALDLPARADALRLAWSC